MTPAGKLDSASAPTETTIGGSKALVIPMEVEFHDLDAMGHVNNVRYFTFMEAARVAFFRHFLGRPADPRPADDRGGSLLPVFLACPLERGSFWSRSGFPESEIPASTSSTK